MNSIALLLLATAQAPGSTPPDGAGPAIDAAQLAELHRHPVEDYRCPISNGHAFDGVSRAKALELLGKPDSKTQPTGRGRDWRTVWRYYVTQGKFKGWSPVEHPSAYYDIAFGPGDVVHSVSCWEYRGNFSGGWTNLIVNQPEEEPDQPRRDPAPATREIHSILYSARTNEEMLAALEKYVKPGDKLKSFEGTTGLRGVCAGTAHTQICIYPDAGMDLVVDAKGKVQMIRRQHAVVDGTDYPEQSITAPGFGDKDHATWFEN